MSGIPRIEIADQGQLRSEETLIREKDSTGRENCCCKGLLQRLRLFAVLLHYTVLLPLVAIKLPFFAVQRVVVVAELSLAKLQSVPLSLSFRHRAAGH